MEKFKKKRKRGRFFKIQVDTNPKHVLLNRPTVFLTKGFSCFELIH